MATPWSIAWTGWCFLVVGWLLSPIISLLINKLFAHLFSDVSREYRKLETITVPDLKQTLINVQEQRMQRTVEDKGPRSDREILAKMEEDLKSAWYEAQDIMDTVEYHRIEQQVLGHTSSWVGHRLDAAAAAAATCVARCFRRSWLWLGPWIDVTRAAFLQYAQRFYQLGGSIFHGFLQHAQGFCRRLPGKFRGATTVTTPGPLLPISGSGASMVGTSISSSTSPTALEATGDAPSELGDAKPPLLQPAEKVAEHEKVNEEIEEEKVKEEEREKVKDEIQEEQEKDKDEEKKEKVKEKPKEEREEKGQAKEEEKKEKVRDEENGALYHCIRSMLIWLTNVAVVARSYRDGSYEEVVGIQSNQRNDIAVYSLFPTFGSKSLSKRIEHIVNILDDSKKSHLLNQQMSSSGKIPVRDTNNESSSSEVLVKDTKKESSSRQEQIHDLDRKIERKVFGRDKELEDICGKFREKPDGHGSKPYSVLGIHGIAGSGKSTLANYVCDHEKKARERYFDLIMFSHVTMNFRVDKIFCDMLREISKDQQYDNKDLEFLRNELVGKLKGKRFLLVLDDLWVNDNNQQERDILLDALHAGKNGSIILVTSRGDDAAAALGAPVQIPIPDLEEEEYLSLFMHHALPGAVHDDEGKLERIGKVIVEKLHWSPIAAVTVAKRLQMNRSIRFWETTANLDVLSRTMGALWWSFQQLDVDIRRCFAYCSTFPAGYKLKRHELVRIWIAQGFVSTTIDNTTEEMEDVGDRYIDELAKFSFVQLRKDWDDNEEITIHDLLHKLAEMVFGSGFFIIDFNHLQKDIVLGVRHLFIQSKNVAEIVEKNQDLRNLRSLIIEEYRHKDTDRMQNMEVKEKSRDLEKILECLFIRLRKLRVLIVKLHHNTDLLLPASIDQMKHLRYVHFDFHYPHSRKVIFPSAFSKLYHMQSVDVRPFFSVSYPKSTGNLIHLRHISGTPDFPNVGRLTSLQAMRLFEVKEGQSELKQLKHLNKLRGTLEISCLGDVGSKEEALEAHLASKERVTKLTLNFFNYRWDDRDRDPDMEAEVIEGLCPPKDLQELIIWKYRGSRYPSWMLSGHQHPDAPNHLRKLVFASCKSGLASFPQDSELFRQLRELSLFDCDWDSMLRENMERLVSLESLYIAVSSSGRRNKMKLPPTLPPSLKKISIHDYDCLPESMEQLVSLESLSISGCDEMEVLPMLPRSLKEMSIDSCDVLSRTCQEEGHPNWLKIQHIPRIQIWSLAEGQKELKGSKVLAE